jgi:hypothetical protein
MNVRFNHPPVIGGNPFQNFNPNNRLHYPNGPGVYIYGLKINIGGVLKFVPVCVGETKDLRKRLYNDHYNGKFVKNHQNIFLNNQNPIKENKELWNFSNNNMSELEILKNYCDMRTYDQINVGRNKTSQTFLTNLLSLKNLIYYQNENFFQLKHNLPFLNPYINISASQAVNRFANSAQSITNTITNFNNNFYFVYSDQFISDDGDIILDLTTSLDLESRLNIEVKLKNELSTRFGIYTTADSKRKGKDFDVKFDFSLVNNELIDLA